MKSSDTIFSKQEFDEIVEFCKENKLELEGFIDMLLTSGICLEDIKRAMFYVSETDAANLQIKIQ